MKSEKVFGLIKNMCDRIIEYSKDDKSNDFNGAGKAILEQLQSNF